MSSVDLNNSLSSSSLLVSPDDDGSDDAPLDDFVGEANSLHDIPSLHNRNSYGWQHVEHLLEDGSRLDQKMLDTRNNAQWIAAVQHRRHSNRHSAHTRKDSESSGSLPNIDLMAIPSMIAPPSLGMSVDKRYKNHPKFDHPVVRQRHYSFKRKDSESSDDFLVGNRPTKSLRENDLMTMPSMIAPPNRRSDIPQQRQPPKPSPFPKHPGRKARSFVSPRDRRRSQKYKQSQQQNNTVAASSRNNVQLRPENHLSIDDTMASVTSCHEELQSVTASPKHLPRVNIGTPVKTPQYTASVDFSDTQSQYNTIEDAFSSERMGDYQSEMFPPLSPDKSLFSHASETSGSPPKSLFSYWLPPPLNKNRKYSTSDEDDSTFDGLSTLYSSMVPSDLSSPVRQVQTADDLEFRPRQPDDLVNSQYEKWPNSVDLVSRCPESPMTPHDQFLYGHLYNDYPGINSTLSRTTEDGNPIPDLPYKSSILPGEIKEETEFKSLESYPPQNKRPTTPVGRKKKPVAIKKTKLKSASTRQHPSRKWDFNYLDTVSSDSVDNSPRMKPNKQSSTIENSVRPGKRRWKFEELLESNDDVSGTIPSAGLNDSSLLTCSGESDRKGMLNKQDNVINDSTPGKRKWKFEELLASPDDGESSWVSSNDELNDSPVPTESDDSLHVEGTNKEDNNDNLVTPGRRKWKFEELLASNDSDENNGRGPSSNTQDNINDATTPGKRKWKFEELLAANDDGNSSHFVRMDNRPAQSDSDDSILNIVMDKKNDRKGVGTQGKRRWKFEDLLASNDHEDEENSSAETSQADLHEIITIFQSHVRGFIARQTYQRCHDAAAAIQKCVRTHNLNRVRQWEEVIEHGLKAFPAMEDDRIQKNLLTVQFNLEQRQNYLDYHSSIISILSSRISDIKTLRRYEQYHRFLSSVVQMQANIRSRQSRKPLTSLENKGAQDMEETGTTFEAGVLSQIEKYAKVHTGFVVLQARCRGVLCRKKYKSHDPVSEQIKRYSKTFAALVSLQALCRGAICRERLHTMHSATILLQHYTRVMLQRRRYRRVLTGMIAFQARVRGVLERKSSVILKSVVVVQSRLRSFIVRTRYLKAKTCIILLQKTFRGMQVMERLKRFHYYATSIQNITRGFVVRTRYAAVRRGVISFQALVRGQHARNIAAVTLSALMNIQCHVRSLLQRKKYNRLKIAAVLVQSKVRAIKQKVKFEPAMKATIRIQSFVRGTMVRKQLRLASSKAVVIQKKWAMYRDRAESQRTKLLYANALRDCLAATKIQSAYRMHRCRYELLQKNEEYRAASAENEAMAATKLQSAVRTWMCRHLLSRAVMERDVARKHNAAVIIQSIVRSIRSQHELASLRQSAVQSDDTAAAVVIQSFGRSVLCQRMLEDMKRRSEEHKLARIVAATTIQARVRSRLFERELSRRRLQACEMRKAVTKLQSFWRSWVCRRDLIVASRYATQIQRCYNRFRIRSPAKRTKLLYANALRDCLAATKIQSAYRMHRCRYELLQKNEGYRAASAENEAMAATKLQSAVRTWMCRHLLSRAVMERDVARKHNAAVIIQSIVRSIRSQHELASLRQSAVQSDDTAAAVVIQSFGRSVLCQRMLEDMKRRSEEHKLARIVAATTIQARVRSRLFERELSRRRLQACEMRKAVTKLQSFWRSWVCRRDLIVASRYATQIQRCYNRFRIRSPAKRTKLLYANALRDCLAATKIQSAYRMHRCRYELLQKNEGYRAASAENEAMAATKLQSAVRTWMCRHLLSRAVMERDVARKHNAAVIIQSIVRSIRSQHELASLRQSAVQSDDTAAAVVIQSFGRSVLCQRMLEDMKRRSEEHKLARIVAATTIQARVRSRLFERELSRRRLQACEMRKAVTKLQSFWRSWVCRRDLIVASRYATQIQRCYNRFRIRSPAKRTKLLYANALRDCLAATKIQSAYRMHRCRYELLQKNEGYRAASAENEAMAATKLQSAVRTWMCRHLLSRAVMERDVARKHNAAVIIQSIVRSIRSQHELASLRQSAVQSDDTAAAVVIQSFGRSVLCQRMLEDMKRRSEEHKLARIVAATTIQARVRSRLFERELSRRRLQACEMRKAVTKLQSFWRSWVCRRDLIVASRYATQIQRCYNRFRIRSPAKRTKLLYANALRDCLAATKIQSAYRMHRCRCELLQKNEEYRAASAENEAMAATKLQSAVRTWMCRHLLSRAVMERDVARKLSRRRLQACEMRKAVTKLQSFWRSWVCRRDLIVASRYATQIQRCYNRFRIRSPAKRTKLLYANALRDCLAATKIQSAYRMHRCRYELLQKNEEYRAASAENEAMAATKLQSAVRTWMCRHLLSRAVMERDVARKHNAAVIIQSIVRSIRSQHELASLRQSADLAVLVRCSALQSQLSTFDVAHLCRVQALFRGQLVRKKFRNACASAVCIQKNWKCMSNSEDVNYSTYVKSVLIIQRKFKLFYSLRHSAAKKIQLYYLSRRMKRNLTKVNRSVNLIQRAVRGYRARCFVQRMKTTRHHLAATKIQSIVRAHRCLSELQTADTNAMKIQRCYLRYKVNFCENASRDEKKAYIDMLKRWHREAMAIRIQVVARSWLCHLKLFRIKSSKADREVNMDDCAAFIVVGDDPVNSSTITSLNTTDASARVIQSKWRSLRYRKELLMRWNAAASIVQSFARSWLCRTEIMNRKAALVEARARDKDVAAVTLQAIARSLICRKMLSELKEVYHAEMQMKETRLLAARKIQSAVRAHRCRNDIQSACMNAATIQRRYRHYKSTWFEKARQDERKAYTTMLERCHRESMAILIQAYVRMHLCRERLSKLKTARDYEMRGENIAAAVVIQSIVRSWLCRQYLTNVRSTAVEAEVLAADMAAITLQAFARSLICQKQLSNIMNDRDAAMRIAAVVIQSFVRSWLCRTELLSLRSKAVEARARDKDVAAVTLQAIARSLICRKMLSELKEVYHAEMQMKETRLLAARKIQSAVRAHRCRNDIQSACMNAATIQRRYRHYKSTWFEKARQDERKAYTTMLERCHRESMVVHIQAVARLWLRRRQISAADFAATVIESKWRSYKCRCEFLMRRQQLERRQTVNSAAAVVIQSVFRSRLCRRELINRKAELRVREAAVVIIQAFARSCNAHNTVQSRIILLSRLMESKSVVLIQSIVRMLLVKSRFDVANKAAHIIQHAWRRFVSSLQEKILVVSELLTVSRYSCNSRLPIPMYKARALLPRDLKRLNRIRSITPHFPRRYECGVFIQEVINSVAIVIQSFVRRYIVSLRIKKLHQAASSVQKTWRSASRRRKLHVAVLKIQSVFRATLVRGNLAIALSSAIILQHFYRNTISRRCCRIEHELIAADEAEQKATVVLQKFFRVCLSKNSTIKHCLERNFFDEDEGLKRLDQYFASLRFSNKQFEEAADKQWMEEKSRLAEEVRLEHVNTIKQKENVYAREVSEGSNQTVLLATDAEVKSVLKAIYQRAEYNVHETNPTTITQCVMAYEKKLSASTFLGRKDNAHITKALVLHKNNHYS